MGAYVAAMVYCPRTCAGSTVTALTTDQAVQPSTQQITIAQAAQYWRALDQRLRANTFRHGVAGTV